MSFILEPGTIPHIQHMYQPSKDWDIGSALAVELMTMINDSMMQKKKVPDLGLSFKIDDRVSMKVAKIAGEYYVGYKGMNSPFLDTIDQIDFMYREKLYIREPMSALLRHAKHIIPDSYDNVEVQVGILWSSNLSGVAPYEVTPNVVTYSLKNIPSTTDLIIAVVSATQIINGHLFFIKDLSPFIKTGNGVFTLENQFTEIGRSVQPNTHVNFIKKASEYQQHMLNSGHFKTISGYEELLATFMNYRVRQMVDGIFYPMNVNEFLIWFKNSYITKKVSKLKKEANQKKKFLELYEQVAYIENNRDAFKYAFDLSLIISACSKSLCREVESVTSIKNFSQMIPTEGIVVTYPLDHQKLIVFKIVSEEFSSANFQKNKDLYK